MTNQEAFDQVWGWFVLDRHEPGGLPTVGSSRCFYYDPSTGNRCAIGCLLPLALLQSLGAVESNHTISALRDHNGRVEQHLEGCGYQFLTDLQVVHDGACNSAALQSRYGKRPDFHGRFEQSLRHLAALYQLTVPPIDGGEGERKETVWERELIST